MNISEHAWTFMSFQDQEREMDHNKLWKILKEMGTMDYTVHEIFQAKILE